MKLIAATLHDFASHVIFSELWHMGKRFAWQTASCGDNEGKIQFSFNCQ
jgi:hypothetical protein